VVDDDRAIAVKKDSRSELRLCHTVVRRTALSSRYRGVATAAQRPPPAGSPRETATDSKMPSWPLA
jgi:hypothetical protein